MVCRARCFGLPLCSAIAREALAQRLGLLLLVRMHRPLIPKGLPNVLSRVRRTCQLHCEMTVNDRNWSSHARLFHYFVTIAYNKPVICFFNCKTDALNPAPCSLLQICRFLLWAERCRGYNLNSRNASGREEGPNKKRAMSY